MRVFARRIVLAAPFLCMGSAHADSPLETFFLTIEAPAVVTPSSGGAQIELWCGYTLVVPGGLVAIQGGDMDVYATEALFANQRVIVRDLPPPPYGSFWRGTRSPEGDAVNDIVAGQGVLGGGGGGAVTDTSNPLLLWTATWATRDFTPRVVELSAFPGDHFSWAELGGGTTVEYPDPGFATIVVRTDCLADLDGNGELDLFDFIAFQNFFMDASPVADLDGDGDLTIFDFLVFQNAFDAGC